MLTFVVDRPGSSRRPSKRRRVTGYGRSRRPVAWVGAFFAAVLGLIAALFALGL